MKRKLPFLMLLFALASQAQISPGDKRQEHKFFDASFKRSFAISAAIRSADIGYTCYNLKTNSNWHEDWLPVKSCGSIAAYIAGEQAIQVGVQYYLHRTNHHKLERIFPYLHVAPNAAGIIFSVKFTK